MNYRGYIKIILCFTVSVLMAIIVPIKQDADFPGIIFSVSGILFSIGISLIVTFNFQGIKNEKFIRSLRKNLYSVRNNYIVYFVISTAAYLASIYWKQVCIIHIINIYFNFSISSFACTIIIFSIAYYIANFVAVHKLKDQLFDQILKEEITK